MPSCTDCVFNAFSDIPGKCYASDKNIDETFAAFSCGPDTDWRLYQKKKTIFSSILNLFNRDNWQDYIHCPASKETIITFPYKFKEEVIESKEENLAVSIKFEGERANQNSNDLNFMPKYQTNMSAGLDLRADIDSQLELLPGDRKNIGTGISFVIDDPNVVALIFPRSGLGSKGLSLANTVGVIDSDYSGEIRLSLVNTGKEPISILPKDRVAQIVFMPIKRVAWNIVEKHKDTERGAGGFGSTGHN